MKTTPFTEKHIALGAKMAEFAGYNMPISYTSINEEHATVRNNAGVFDVSHMGEFRISGPNALALIQRITSNDASKLTEGKAQYTYFPNETGGIIDDLLVYCIQPNEEYWLVVNAANIEKDWNWVVKQNTVNATIENISDNISQLAIQGPKANEIIQSLTDVELANLKYYTFTYGTFAGVPDVLISATGYTGSGGVEIYIKNEGDNAEKIWNALFETGSNQGLKPIGLGARDTLRLEKGFCLYGHELNDQTNPIEAGLGWITKLNKEDFIAKDIISKAKEEGIQRKLVGFEMIDRGIPRQDYKIVDAGNNEIGVVTSGTQSPTLGKAIGIAYINKENSAEGNEIFISIRDKAIKAQIVKMPFV
ncbi:MAG TPA: glycine cleavage system aminomethyltransferase GcvT [Edaphocola sp.]|nr:glycine cleavage system aminomethyltransferase GcvT [Edaphocola sp.]